MRMDNQSFIHDLENSFTLEFWVKPDKDLQSEMTVSHSAKKNFVVDPNCGDVANETVMGVAVDCKGITVYEKTPHLFYATLVHESEIYDWTHIAIVYKQKIPFLYMNGRFIQMGIPSSSTTIYASDVLRVYSYQGQIRDVRIWDYCRSEVQLHFYMNKKMDRKEKGLLGLWQIDKEEKTPFISPNNQVKHTEAAHTGDIKVSIIIPSYNKYPLNLLTLYSLEKQTFDFSKMEVIFIDVASTDQTYEALKDYRPPYYFTYIRCNENVGKAQVQHIGKQSSKGKILLFLDAETITKPSFVKKQYHLHKS
jgi:hypothetical protein